MKPIEVPKFTPCDKCAGGKILKDGKSEQCECWIRWWAQVRASVDVRGK